MTHLLQQDQTSSQSFSNSSTNWAPNIQLYEPKEAILIQTTTDASSNAELEKILENPYFCFGYFLITEWEA